MVRVVEVRNVVKDFDLHRSRTLRESLIRSTRGGSETTTFRALDDVSFDVNQGESVGLIGLNGSGKSTLLKLITGVMRPDAGTVRSRGRTAGLIEVGAGLHPELTGRENIFLNGAILGMTERQINASFDSIVDFAEIERFIDTQVKFYSSGMFLRLAFSVAVHTEPDVFVVDEVLSVGDEPFQAKSLERIAMMRKSGQTLVIVSHDLASLAHICHRGIVLGTGRVVADMPIDESIATFRASF
jgi:ABC-2 type transport system ATP-binding protein